MAKWYGIIGFFETIDSGYGVFKNKITEKPYYGDMQRSTESYQTSSSKVNDDISISNELSILADQYANQNFHSIKYAEFMGVKWTVKKIEVKHPRLILTLGGVYNG